MAAALTSDWAGEFWVILDRSGAEGGTRHSEEAPEQLGCVFQVDFSVRVHVARAIYRLLLLLFSRENKTEKRVEYLAQRIAEAAQ